jgi:hypothetical protein
VQLDVSLSAVIPLVCTSPEARTMPAHTSKHAASQMTATLHLDEAMGMLARSNQVGLRQVAECWYSLMAPVSVRLPPAKAHIRKPICPLVLYPLSSSPNRRRITWATSRTL